MKRWTSVLALFLLFSGCATGARRPASTAFVVPKLYLSPAPIFDAECQQKTGYKIDSAMQTEFYEKAGIFQKEWDHRAGQLISSSEEMAGRKFDRNEYSVALTLCKWIPMGDPAFIVSVRPYLGASRVDAGANLPLGMSAFVSMTHHELLHSLVNNIINPEFSEKSALFEKYKNEHFNVLVHLHLMAVQKAVNERIGGAALVRATEDLYTYIGGDYQRAWDIVRIEGAQSFLNELKSYNSKKSE